MSFGTFRRLVDRNPLEADEGDVVLRYEADDGTTVEALLLHEGAYETDTWGGNPIKRMEYGVGVSGVPSGARERAQGEEPGTYDTKAMAEEAAKDLVRELVGMGHGSY